MAEACYALPIAKTVDVGIIAHNLQVGILLSFPYPESHPPQVVHDPSGFILNSPDTPPAIRALVRPSLAPADSAASLADGDPNFVLTLSDFDAVRYVGAGGHGRVFLVYDRYSHKHLAMKVVPKRTLRLPKWVKLFEEQRIMRLLAGCPWAVRLEGSFEDSLNFYMVMVRCLFFGLLSASHMLLAICGGWGPAAAAPQTAEVQTSRRQADFRGTGKSLRPSGNPCRPLHCSQVLAVQDLHQRRIMHRDIKLENILLDKDGHALLADYGLSIGFDAETRVWNDVWRGYHVHKLPEPGTVAREDRGRDLTAEMVGTMGYAAPELIDARYTYHSYEVDVWSLGVCVYMLTVGAVRFSSRGLRRERG